MPLPYPLNTNAAMACLCGRCRVGKVLVQDGVKRLAVSHDSIPAVDDLEVSKSHRVA